MKSIATAIAIRCLAIPAAAMLSGCQGILSGIYDEPASGPAAAGAGQLYVDTSAWDQWHYIDLAALRKLSEPDPSFDTSSLWHTYSIPAPDAGSECPAPSPEQPGIYTYWYDVFGAGITNSDYRGFVPAAAQPEPESWTLAVHRNNVRTNGCAVCETSYTSIDDCPADARWLENLDYRTDEWNQTDVWAVQDKMLLGIIGNQGIYVNRTLSRWLSMEIPPMPPAFAPCRHVFVLKMADGTFAALQLADYIGADGTKCCLTINYRFLP